MSAHQTNLDRQLADAKHRPVVGLDGAKHLLDMNEDYILELIKGGELSHAWNISLGATLREVRILRVSIDNYMAPVARRIPVSEASALKLLLPPGHKKPFLTNPEIQRALNCGSDHVLDLVKARPALLELQPGSKYTRGQNGSALITVASFEAFINQRRMK